MLSGRKMEVKGCVKSERKVRDEMYCERKRERGGGYEEHEAAFQNNYIEQNSKVCVTVKRI